ncbi:MAG: hypothetical protein CMB11_09585 [Euryarchaeota archaeon]|nr:hypothetical protein [Euryarchaeota archaeon]
MVGLRARSLALAALLLFSTMTFAPAVSAVGPNQNDMGMTSGDLPDNLSSTTSVPNLIFSGSTTGSGDLVSGTDEFDYLRVALASNEGLAAELSFSSGDDFDLSIYDTNQNTMASSYFGNPETVSTNSSFTNHGGMVYIEIAAYLFSGTSGSWNLTIWIFNTGSSGGGGGSGSSIGSAPPNPCTGNGTTASDILEPNDSVSTATLASTLPLDCTGLSIDSSFDEDFFEVVMTAGVTYYVNVSFTHFNGDIDLRWETATGGYLSGSGGTSNLESMTVLASTSQSTYVQVYGYSGAINTYDIEITTDLPGGGQSFTSVVPTVVNETTTDLIFSGLTNGSTYSVNLSFEQILPNGTVLTTSLGGLNHTANSTGHNATVTHTHPIVHVESEMCIVADLYDVNGTYIASGEDCYDFNMLTVEATSSTSGDIEATNMSVNTPMTLWWFVYDTTVFINEYIANGNDVEAALNASVVNQSWTNFTPSTTAMSWQVNWTGITTTNVHGFIGILWEQGATVNLSTGEGYNAEDAWEFTPQLPSLVITSVTKSTTAATNDVRTEGLDLVNGDGYHYQVRLTDGAGATLQNSTVTSFTATAQNMSLPAWSFATPNGSGTYCAAVDLYTSSMVQLIGDSDCFTLTFDNDGDGVANEYDLCPNTPLGSTVNADGCALSQIDSDNDGYNDSVDMFPTNPDQHWDTDGDGYGDNSAGNGGDAYPADASQWADSDGDGYGDNASGTNGDAFPLDSTQWADSDGDGYGDNANGNNPDLWPNDSSQWSDSDGDGYGDNPSGTQGDAFPNDATQWQDSDGDGYGDNPAGNDADLWPNDNTQWKDDDGDGYGDNPSGTDGDAFPSDGTQWKDRDGDGYGDNAAGTNADAFPDDGTQWADRDGDGHGDNAAGVGADAFPDDATQWADRDGDGYGDNINGNLPDHCPDTPQGEPVDAKGCATVELDEDNDGVNDDLDVCPQTNASMSVDGFGCAEDQKDGDLDGVMNLYDACPNTPLGRTVDAAGCAAIELDTDEDGIDDARDQCPSTTPGLSVNGEGCAANERDADEDGVMDADDLCDYTDAGEEVDDQGCAANQRDTDNDGVVDAEDACTGTLSGSTVDGVGCALYQLDADGDMISDSVDQCDATPAGEAVDQVGCSDSQKDEDGDGRSDAVDDCPGTPAGIVPDVFGCAPSQRDTDLDGIDDGNDLCPSTTNTTVVNADGCALYQLDTDNDGTTDDEDAFPNNATAQSDRDGDGVADQFDAYPDDGLRSTLEPERNSTGLILGVVALLAIAGLAALLVVRREGATVATGLGTTADVDAMAEATFAAEDKALPELQESAGATTWEENGVHWNRDAQGNLTYWDASLESWVPYEG